MWAGGITAEQAIQLGELGIFGLYVTTSVSEAAPVSGEYLGDPGLASEKRPTRAGIVNVKTLVEGGFLAKRLSSLSRQTPEIQALVEKIGQARQDTQALAKILPDAWRAWWRDAPTTQS
jgi:hypothetical protein